MDGALSKLGNDPTRLGFASFTRAARAEAVTRASAAWGCPPELLAGPGGWFRTIHSTCYRCVGVASGQLLRPEVKESIEWISKAIDRPVVAQIDEDTGHVRYRGDEAGAAALNCWNLARATLRDLADVAKEVLTDDLDGRLPGLPDIVRIAERYETAKRLDGRLDYTDLLARFAGFSFSAEFGASRVAPVGETPDVSAWLFDEQQDTSPLLDAVCKRLVSAPSVQWCYVVGDPFQCQPAGTPVLTANGYKAIEHLDPATDRLISFNKKDGRFYGTGGGVRFQKAWRDVDSGGLVEVTFSDGTKSVSTANHKWIVRTNRQAAFATYLMRKGTRWRIGTVQMFANWQSEKSAAKSGDFRLKMRMSQENADAAWVLKVCGTDREARMYEQIASCKYGIPQVTFRPPSGCRNNLDAEFIDGVFDAMGDLTVNGLRCLADHGLELLHPLCIKGDRAKNGSKACRYIQAANLLPGIHVAPKLLPDFFARRKRGSGDRRGSRNVGSECEWVAVESARRLPPGETVRVYSLEVEKHHTYVTHGGVVTGNSIYGFAGSSADCFLGWPAEKERVMPKSYRCPAPILSLGEACLRPIRGYFDRGIAPADHDGVVEDTDDIAAAVDMVNPNESWLLIARTNYQSGRLFAAMCDARKPVRWVKTPEGVSVKGEGMRALRELQYGGAISGAQWSRCLNLLPTRAGRGGPRCLEHGTKKRFADAGEQARWDAIFLGDLPEVGATDALQEKIRSGDWVALIDHGGEWGTQADRWGVELACEPKVKVGTIHSVKGAEADNVLMLTTTSSRVCPGDEECRLAYVGVTRARRRLVIVNERGWSTPRLPVP